MTPLRGSILHAETQFGRPEGNQRAGGDGGCVEEPTWKRGPRRGAIRPHGLNPDNAFRGVANQMFPGRYGPYGTSPSEALLHELVHAMRTIKGMTDLTPTGPPFNDTIEEFVAVLVTNIHTGELTPGGLRAGHTGFMSMQPNWTTSQGFLSDRNNRDLVTYFIRQDSSFCNTLAQTVYVNSFNPIRLLLRPLVTSAN